ncbi:MAG: hypothetical protein JXP34_00805 [Planctomycetes bacterium]|nr:hypothetical protein [Planctomycetota bacterium]
MDPKLLQSIVLVAAIVIITSVMIRRLALRQAARAGRQVRGRSEPSRRPSVIDGGETLAKAQEVVLDLSTFTRELEARLDTKIHYLRRLIEEADQATERLSGAIAEARSQGEPRPGVSKDPRRAEAERLADEGLEAGEISARTGLPDGEIELLVGLRRKRRG